VPVLADAISIRISAVAIRVAWLIFTRRRSDLDILELLSHNCPVDFKTDKNGHRIELHYINLHCTNAKIVIDATDKKIIDSAFLCCEDHGSWREINVKWENIK
jgi:hypothetical protein